jgi:predicted dehydrogenase
MSLERVLGIAVVGAGNRGMAHLDTISRLPDLYRLVAVCDAREERRQVVAAQFGVPVFDHPLTMLERVQPDVVFVIVPPDAHHIITRAAAAHRCHVISETPIATTLSMADDMIAAAQRYGVKLEVAENVWRWPAERLKRRLVDEGVIGRVTQAHLWYRSGSYHGMNAIRRFITSEPWRVMGFVQRVDVEPYVDLVGERQTTLPWELGVIEFAGGERCVYQLPAGIDRGNYWEIAGTRGALMGNELVLFEGEQRRPRRLPIETITAEVHGRPTIHAVRVNTDPPVVWENPYRDYALPPHADDVARADILVTFHRAVVDDVPPAYGAPNARRDQELVIAVRESARLGSVWLELPLREPTGLEQQQLAEFRQTYGADPFADIERLLGRLFPRRGVRWTVV